jgi:hypothetical protein
MVGAWPEPRTRRVLRLVHNAHPLNLSGESILKLKPKLTREIDPA